MFLVVVDGSTQQALQRDFLKIGSVKASLLSDQRLKFSFLYGLHQDVLLNAVLCDEPVDYYVACLSDSVASVLGLFVHGRVPVSIVKDYVASPCEI